MVICSTSPRQLTCYLLKRRSQMIIEGEEALIFGERGGISPEGPTNGDKSGILNVELSERPTAGREGTFSSLAAGNGIWGQVSLVRLFSLYSGE